MRRQELLDLLCDCLELPKGSLREETPIASVEGWDSLAWLSIIAALDSRFGVALEGSAIPAMQVVGDVLDYIERKSEQ